MRKLIIGLLLALLSGHASGTEIDIKKSKIIWIGAKVSSKHTGTIALKSAGIKQDKSGKIEHGTFIVDMNSITVDELQGKWSKKFLGHIKSKDFFMIEKYPTAKLVFKEIAGNYIQGDLTIKDKTNKVKFPFKKIGSSYNGTLKFDRTKFGIIYGSGNFIKGLGDKLILDEVQLDFKIVLK